MAEKKTKARAKKSGKKLKIALCVMAGIVIVSILAAFIYFAWQLTIPKPPESSPDERLEWMCLINGEGFDIDPSTDDAQLIEFMMLPVDRLEVGKSTRLEPDVLTCTFYTKRPVMEVRGTIRIGDDALVCEAGGSTGKIWLERGEYPTLIYQGEKERLLFTPDRPDDFS